MTYYGVDLYGRPRLAELLRELDQIEELDWIRILYNYPSYFTEELYEVLASARRVIPYLDMPLQHINDHLLKMMNRRHTRAETEAIINRLRATMPGLVLRTTSSSGSRARPRPSSPNCSTSWLKPGSSGWVFSRTVRTRSRRQGRPGNCQRTSSKTGENA